MKFKYRALNLLAPFSKKQKLLRPVIPISLSYGSISIRYEALIDSGADFSILPAGLAEILRINLDKLPKIYFSGAIGDVTTGAVGEITLILGEKKFKTKVVFATLSGNTGILGQYGFFDKYIVKFDLSKQEIELKNRKRS